MENVNLNAVLVTSKTLTETAKSVLILTASIVILLIFVGNVTIRPSSTKTKRGVLTYVLMVTSKTKRAKNAKNVLKVANFAKTPIPVMSVKTVTP
jgi:hypothetical protein